MDTIFVKGEDENKKVIAEDYNKWLASPLFDGGIRPDTSEPDSADAFLEDLIEGRGEGKVLYNNLQRLLGGSGKQAQHGGPAGAYFINLCFLPLNPFTSFSGTSRTRYSRCAVETHWPSRRCHSLFERC
mgnify:FL=1